MAIILGIDPGSRVTGYGLVNAVAGKLEFVSCGTIRTPDASLPDRLKVIFSAIEDLIESFAPQEFAIEQVFMSKSAASALKLGQARGAAIVAAVRHNIPVEEYAARKVKQAVVGTGAADKYQIQHMVKTLLKLPAEPVEDAADALAVAICHAHTQANLIRMASSRYSRGRLAN